MHHFQIVLGSSESNDLEERLSKVASGGQARVVFGQKVSLTSPTL